MATGDGDRLLVVGIGADGWAGLGPAVRERLLACDVLLGGARQLAMVPEPAASGAASQAGPGALHPGPVRPGPRRLGWPTPLRERLPGLLADLAGQRVGVLASGDPMVSGIGSTLVGLLGADAVEVLPAPSSVALARSRMGWPAEHCAVVSVVGRPLELVLREAVPGRRLLVLGSDEESPAALAALLTRHGLGASTLTVLGNLAGSDETRRSGRADAWRGRSPRLAVIAVECAGQPPARLGWTAGLADDAFDNDGQVTRRDIRASALARLQPFPGEHLWDVGAGSGSIGIEWMRAAPGCRCTAIEANPERAARAARNAARLGVPGLQVVQGRAPDALTGLAAPDAIFVGGGATVPGVLDGCLAALQPGGRIVVHAVTLECEQLLADAFHTHGGELTRLAVETAAPLGRFTGWTPGRTITQWFHTVA